MVFDQPHGSAAQTNNSRLPKDSYKYYTFIDLKVHSHTEESESIYNWTIGSSVDRTNP